jgi:oligopeptide transport system substrate-binding protein
VVPQSEWAAAHADPILASQLHVSSLQCNYYYGFNTSKPPFDNPLVRKAFIAAVDRQGLIDSVLGYAQQPALTFTPPGEFGFVDGFAEGIGIPYNPTQAQEWLAQAGYPNGANFPTSTLMFNTSEGHRLIAEYAQQNWWDNLNVTVLVENIEWSQYIHLVWCMDYYDAYNFLNDSVMSNVLSFGSLANDGYFDLLNEAALTPDLPQRADLYKQAEEILVETDAVMLPIYFYASGVATQPYLVRGYGSGGFGGWVADWRFRQCDGKDKGGSGAKCG